MTESGEVYNFGWVNFFKKFQFFSLLFQFTKTKIKFLQFSGKDGKETSDVPLFVFSNKNIEFISCGWTHTVFLESDGTLKGIGNNSGLFLFYFYFILFLFLFLFLFYFYFYIHIFFF